MTYREHQLLVHQRERRGVFSTIKLCGIILLILGCIIAIEGCAGGGGHASSPAAASVSPTAAAAASTSPTASVSHPATDLARMPTVAIIGDQIAGSIATPAVLAAHPLWEFFPPDPGVPGETSTHTFSRMPGILATHRPDIVIIFTSTFDLADPSWDPPCGDTTTYITCSNMEDMVKLAHAAGAKVLISTLPITTQAGAAGTSLYTTNPYLGQNEVAFNHYALEGAIGGEAQDGEVDIAAAEVGDWTDDGVEMNATGAELAAAAIQVQVEELAARDGLGGVR